MFLSDLLIAATAHPDHPIISQPLTVLYAAWLKTCTHILITGVTHHLPLSYSQLNCLWDDWVAFRNPIIGTQIDLPLAKEGPC